MVSFLKNHELEQFFEFIYAGTTLFGKHKVIKKLLKEKQLLPHEVMYIGDETRDINSAKKSRVQCVGVTWGFNSSQALAKQEPDFLIHNPYELMTILGHDQCNIIDDQSQVNSLIM